MAPECLRRTAENANQQFRIADIRDKTRQRYDHDALDFDVKRWRSDDKVTDLRYLDDVDDENSVIRTLYNFRPATEPEWTPGLICNFPFSGGGEGLARR